MTGTSFPKHALHSQGRSIVVSPTLLLPEEALQSWVWPSRQPKLARDSARRQDNPFADVGLPQPEQTDSVNESGWIHKAIIVIISVKREQWIQRHR